MSRLYSRKFEEEPMTLLEYVRFFLIETPIMLAGAILFSFGIAALVLGCIFLTAQIVMGVFWTLAFIISWVFGYDSPGCPW